MKTVAELRKMRQRAISEMQALINAADKRSDGGMTDEEEETYDAYKAEVSRLDADIQRREELTGLLNSEPVAHQEQRQMGEQGPQAPAVHTPSTQDTAESIMCRWIRSGDVFAEREYRAAAQEEYRKLPEASAEIQKAMREERASNNTGMNITTAADGANLVPTGHYNRIVERRDEMGLRSRLNLMNVPGVGTTVNVPIDDEADGEFIATGEMGDDNTTNVFDRDAPAVGTVAMTLAKYTKKIELTDELLIDNDSNLLQWLEYRVGVGLGKTDNNLIVTAALAGGTAALTLDSATAIGVTEIPELVYAQAEGYEDGSVWLMKKATEGYLRGLTGNNFQLVSTPAPGGPRDLWTYPVYTTSKMAAIQASAKSLVFGNFRYMGVRQMPGLTLLRDPYTVDGKVILKYYYRVVYKVMQAGAIIYATHPSA